MRKFLLLIVAAVMFAYASDNNADINKKLDFIIKKMNEMEMQLKSKDKEIESLKKEVKNQKKETEKKFILSSCDKIGVKDFRYSYQGQILPYYELSFVLTNNYPYDISNISGKLIIKDKDGSTILADFIKRDTLIRKGESLKIHKRHPIIGEIEKILKDENPSSLKVTFTPTMIRFSNGQQAKCGGLFNISF